MNAEPLPSVPSITSNAKAENVATYLCHLVLTWAQSRGITNQELQRRSGVSTSTIERLKHRKIRNYPHLLNFVKLLAAADLEICIVRANHGYSPDPNNDPTPPPAYLTGTEGNLKWPSAP